MITNPGLEKKIFLDTLEKFEASVLARAFGNYTKHYELFKRIENIERFFKEAISEDRKYNILDVGCGDGYHICVFNSLDRISERICFTGVDISDAKVYFAARVARDLSFHNLNFQIGSAENLGFEDAVFDIVLCNDVVEHLEYPEKCFEEILRVLKPGGVVIITTPNADSVVHRIMNKKNLEKEKKDIGKDEHISVKGLREWVAIAERKGFCFLAVRRGALIFGGHKWNKHPVFFAIVILIDKMLDFMPFAKNWGEAITLKLSKPKE